MRNTTHRVSKEHHVFIGALFLALTTLSLGACDSNTDVSGPETNSADTTRPNTNSVERPESTSDIRRGQPKRGQYRYFADAAVFTECTSGQSWPIAASEQAAEIERAYLEVTRKDNQAMQPITVSIEAHIEVIEGMEAGTKMPHLIIDRFAGIDSNQECDLPPAELIGTYWRLNSLANFEAMPAGLRKEPHMILASDGNMTGHGGCNAMFAQYRQNSDALTFNGVAGTRMACPTTMALESAFHLALNSTASYRIDGQYLYLETESGKPLATLEAVYLY